MIEKLVKQMIETEKRLDNPKNFLCRCKDLKTGKAIYCYRHRKEAITLGEKQ